MSDAAIADGAMAASRRSVIWRRVRLVWITVGITATVVFTAWSLLAFRASPAARNAIRSDAAVTVTHASGAWRFAPARLLSPSGPGLLFIPGGLVDPIAYAPLARAIAEAGFPATILELPRRGAFGGANDPELFARMRTLLRNADGPNGWVVAGHSRGAVVAVQLAAERPEGLVGLVLIGTSHPRDVSLAALTTPVTKIAGTRDGLASVAKVKANAHNLPASTTWVWIEGGNHSQFGWYGFQPGDRWATIAPAVQRDLMLRGVLAALRSAAPRA